MSICPSGEEFVIINNARGRFFQKKKMQWSRSSSVKTRRHGYDMIISRHNTHITISNYWYDTINKYARAGMKQ